MGKLCKKYDLPHIVNNAYGVQSSKCMHVIEEVRIRVCVCVCVCVFYGLNHSHRLIARAELMHLFRVLTRTFLSQLVARW